MNQRTKWPWGIGSRPRIIHSRGSIASAFAVIACIAIAYSKTTSWKSYTLAASDRHANFLSTLSSVVSYADSKVRGGKDILAGLRYFRNISPSPFWMAVPLNNSGVFADNFNNDLWNMRDDGLKITSEDRTARSVFEKYCNTVASGLVVDIGSNTGYVDIFVFLHICTLSKQYIEVA